MIRTMVMILLLGGLVSGCGSNEVNESEESNYSSSEDDSDYSSSSSYSEDEEEVSEGGYEDGTHTATVRYYNPSTGTNSTYTLDVEVEDNELTTIHWPNDGVLDETHFSAPDISSGEASFTSDEGYEYTVELDE